MTNRAKTRGFTAWANMRMSTFDQTTNNIILDLLKGVYMKYLLQSYTGQKDEKFQSFDNLSKDQLQTRIKWFTKELKANQVLDENVNIDPKLIVIRQFKEVIDMLWILVCVDIKFLWDRIGFLSNLDEIFIKVPFTWIPLPPVENKKPTNNRESSQMSIFSGMSMMGGLQEDENNQEEKEKEITENDRFPGFDIMKSFSIHVPLSSETGEMPPFDAKLQIKEMINIQLRTINGKKVQFKRLNDLSDARVLCGLINTFVPYLFPIEILLNDRWCLNLALRTIDQILNCESTFDSEDLVEADAQSICAFFCYLFMILYKYKQCQAVVNKYKDLEVYIRKAVKSLQNEHIDPEEKNNIEQTLADLKYETQILQEKYDLKQFFKWVDRVDTIRNEVYESINNKLNLRFDWFEIQEDISPNALCTNQAINLSLTNGLAFYKLVNKEFIARSRILILKEKKNNPKFIFNLKSSSNVLEKILRVPNSDPVEIDPKNYQDYEIFVEVYNNSKVLKSGTIFFYQVFPTSSQFYHNFLLKAVQDKDYEAVKRMVEFFSKYNPSFINISATGSLNTALHLAAETGCIKILHYLLDNYSAVNAANKDGNTPLFFSIYSKLKDAVKLLIEYGADATIVNNKNETIVKVAKSEEYKKFLNATILKYQTLVSSLVDGNHDALEKAINEHINGKFTLSSLRSRFISGSTLLHTCAHFGHYDLVEKLLITHDTENKLLSPNIRDYKGATALHRTSNVEIIKILINSKAEINSRDLEGNIALHSKCFGEKNKPSDLEAIRMLLKYEADFTIKNKKFLLPLHLAAMQGRTDVIQILIEWDTDKKMIKVLNTETEEENVSSPTFLALSNDHLECANCLVKYGISLKKGEAESIMVKILLEKVIVKDIKKTLTFLCQNGCNLKHRYDNGNTALHYAALISGEPMAIRILLSFGAFVNIVNDEMKSPLFNAVISNNPLAAASLIEYNADYKIRNNEGQTAFDLIRDISEWMKMDCFDAATKQVLLNYERKNTRFLVKSLAEKVKLDFGVKAKLMERRKVLVNYINHHDNYIMKNTRITRSKSAFPNFY